MCRNGTAWSKGFCGGNFDGKWQIVKVVSFSIPPAMGGKCEGRNLRLLEGRSHWSVIMVPPMLDLFLLKELKGGCLQRVGSVHSIGRQYSKGASSAAYWLWEPGKYLNLFVSFLISVRHNHSACCLYCLGLLWRFKELICSKPLELIVPACGATLFCQGFPSHLYHPFVLKTDCQGFASHLWHSCVILGKSPQSFSPVKIGILLLKVSSWVLWGLHVLIYLKYL